MKSPGAEAATVCVELLELGAKIRDIRSLTVPDSLYPYAFCRHVTKDPFGEAFSFRGAGELALFNGRVLQDWLRHSNGVPTARDKQSQRSWRFEGEQTVLS